MVQVAALLLAESRGYPVALHVEPTDRALGHAQLAAAVQVPEGRIVELLAQPQHGLGHYPIGQAPIVLRMALPDKRLVLAVLERPEQDRC